MKLISWLYVILIVFFIGITGFFSRDYEPLTLTSELSKQIGLQIWKNECGGRYDGLTTWNKGEDFASLGIGHFIWYPEKKQTYFKESFPALIAFFKSHGVKLPDWLNEAKNCPWQNREEFIKARHEQSQQELRQLLADHIDLQILFIVKRLKRALPALLKSVPQSESEHLKLQFNRLAYTSNGLYALLDYLNFKGEGISCHESYQGQGWGLLQVLQQLRGFTPGQPAVIEFVEAAKNILTARVENAPPERQERQWLKGWHNRIETYRHFSINEIDLLLETD